VLRDLRCENKEEFYTMNKILLAAASFVAVAGAAQAADNEMRPYVGVDVTRVMADYKTDSYLGVSGDDLLEDSLNGINPYVGLQFNKYVGAELGYLQTESGKKSNILGSGVDTKVKMSGFSADVVGTLPVTKDEKVALLGSAGLGRYKADIKATGPGGSASDDSSDTGFRLGAGAQYQITDNIGVRAMARYIKVDFDDSTDNLITASIGLNYKF
jgi:opacity protein-like surface antigen